MFPSYLQIWKMTGSSMLFVSGERFCHLSIYPFSFRSRSGNMVVTLSGGTGKTENVTIDIEHGT